MRPLLSFLARFSSFCNDFHSDQSCSLFFYFFYDLLLVAYFFLSSYFFSLTGLTWRTACDSALSSIFLVIFSFLLHVKSSFYLPLFESLYGRVSNSIDESPWKCLIVLPRISFTLGILNKQNEFAACPISSSWKLKMNVS